MTSEVTRNEAGNGGATRDPIVERAATSAHQAVDRVAAKVSPAIERARAVARDSAGTVQAQLDTLSSMPRDLTESCRSYVRDRPMTALGVAVLVGFVLSRLLRSS